MNQKLTNPLVKKFIDEHLSADLSLMALRKSPFSEISMKELLIQIEGKSKAKEKLPSFFQTDGIIYPPTISMEQCSSEQTAAYKASLCSGNCLTDLTGGFGVDSWMFAKSFGKVFYYEKNEALVDIVQHNFLVSNTRNITIHHGDGINLLKQQKQLPDWIYIDPSRRDYYNRKMHAFADCDPDIVANLPILFEYSEKLMIKASPMFDIEKAISELKFVEEIHVVAVKNEVREVLYLLKKNHESASKIHAINILSPRNYQSFLFLKEEEKNAKADYSLPLRYLYEPNNAVMKTGAFELIATRFNILKLYKNSHLYTSDQIISDFPGRIFRIKKVLPYKHVKNIAQANIITRNFPDSPDIIRKKLALKDGGNDFLFCTTLIHGKPILILCEKDV